MTSTMKNYDIKAESALTEVIGVFREITTKLLRTSCRTMRRVIFSKNNEEFDEIIRDSLLKKFQREKLGMFLHLYKNSQQVLEEKSGSQGTLEKIIKILGSLKDDKLKMIYQIIRIITGGNSSQSDRASIISSDISAILTSSEKISSLNEENSYKDIMSLISMEEANLQKPSKVFLTKKRLTTGKYKSPLKNPKMSLPNLFAKTYEMSDKASLHSLDENNCNVSQSSNNSKLGDSRQMSNSNNNSKSKLTKINTQIQNKFNINVISPQIRGNSNFGGSFIQDPASLFDKSNHMNLSLNNFNNNQQQNYSIYTQCPKVIIDYDHSSNSDLDHLLVTSEMDKKKTIRTNSASSLKNSNFNCTPKDSVFKSNVNSIKNTPMFSMHQNNNICSNGSQLSSPDRKKPKQVFFPCEIEKSEIPKTSLENQNIDDINKYKGGTSCGNYYNFSAPNTMSNGIFNLNGFPQMTGQNNIYPLFSSCNTPRSPISQNPYISDLITGVKTKDSGIFNIPYSSARQLQDSASKNFSFMNSNFSGISSIPGPVPINYNLYNQDQIRNNKK